MRHPGTYSRKEKEEIIVAYAKHYDSPIGNFEGFNDMLRENFGFGTTRKTVAKLLGY